PLNAATDREIRDTFDHLAAIDSRGLGVVSAGVDTAVAASSEVNDNPVLRIEEREIRAIARHGRVIWFDFKTLCGGPRSQNDYLELAQQFDTVVLSGVPKMSAAMSSEARRFTWLVDVLYDHRVKLIVSADVPAQELYTEGMLANEFTRTVSRLVEMRSTDYMETTARETQTHFTER
ncbi:MAG: cell division protein ZapE, partial [Burkholderiaceae bacterium]